VHFEQLYSVVRRNIGAYLLWLLGNVGGLAIAYLASVTIWYFHGNLGRCVPGPEVFLITGTISLAIAGVSYLRLRTDEPSTSLSPFISVSWPFPLMAVYGVLIAMGTEPSSAETAPSNLELYILSFIIAFICLLWASLTWAHERGIRQEMEAEPEPPPAPELDSANLPKLEGNGETLE
jgi:hypothetical protein